MQSLVPMSRQIIQSRHQVNQSKIHELKIKITNLSEGARTYMT